MRASTKFVLLCFTALVTVVGCKNRNESGSVALAATTTATQTFLGAHYQIVDLISAGTITRETGAGVALRFRAVDGGMQTPTVTAQSEGDSTCIFVGFETRKVAGKIVHDAFFDMGDAFSPLDACVFAYQNSDAQGAALRVFGGSDN